MNKIKSVWVSVFSGVLATSMLIGSQAHADWRVYGYGACNSQQIGVTVTGQGGCLPLVSDTAFPLDHVPNVYVDFSITNSNSSAITYTVKLCRTNFFGGSLQCNSQSRSFGAHTSNIFVDMDFTGTGFKALPADNPDGTNSAYDYYYINFVGPSFTLLTVYGVFTGT